MNHKAQRILLTFLLLISFCDVRACICITRNEATQLVYNDYSGLVWVMFTSLSNHKEGEVTSYALILKSYKGKKRGIVKVYENTGSSCNAPLLSNNSYMLIADYDRGQLTTSSCHGTEIIPLKSSNHRFDPQFIKEQNKKVANKIRIFEDLSRRNVRHIAAVHTLAIPLAERPVLTTFRG